MKVKEEENEEGQEEASPASTSAEVPHFPASSAAMWCTAEVARQSYQNHR